MSSVGPDPEDSHWSGVIAASERLAASRSLEAVVSVLRETAREVAGSDGIAVVIREQGKCFYAAEDAVAPLWTGKRFPVESCISGWAMTHRKVVAIPDIRLDGRIPQDAYRTTFVRSLVMAPIGAPDAVAALGAYWSDVRDHDPAVVARLEALARAAAIAIENARLIRAIQETDRQRQMALTAGRMGVWSLDLATGEFVTSRTCRENFGRDPDRDFPYEALRDAVHPADRERVFAAIDNSLSTGADYDVEYRLMTPGGEERWIGVRAQPTLGPGGRAGSMSGVSIDITERKHMEEQLRDAAATLERRVEERTRELVRTQEALRQSQKLEAMGQLTGGVAHDFNNLLTPIMGSLDLLQRRGVGGDREQRLIAGALESSERAKTLVQRLLAFARRQPLKPTSVDIAALLVEMTALLATTLGPQVALSLDLHDDLPTALADQNQVEMAILNLALNARDAMPDGGRLTISARVEQAGPDHRAGLAPGDYVAIAVSDTGVGMDEETCARAIEPFYSTKGVGKGTGLGLSMVHGLVTQLGGGLSLSSTPGSGARIELWLPVGEARVAQVGPAAAASIRPTRGVALLVDDEDLVRASTADMLSDLGFEVIEASSGDQALELFGADPRIGVVVTDYLMPRMTGAELAAAVRARRPQTGVLIVSGYSDVLGLPADLARLEKPFRQADLAASIAALAEAPARDGTRLGGV